MIAESATEESKPSRQQELQAPLQDVGKTLCLTARELEEVLAHYPDLKDIRAAVILNVGIYGGDCAGGCG